MFDKEIIEKAFETIKNNDAIAFFSLFFNVNDNDTDYDLETRTKGGVNMFVAINKKNWKEDFQTYVNGFDVDEEINIMQSDRSYQNAFTYRQSVEDFEDYHKWLICVSKLLDGQEPMERVSVPFKTLVLTFNKMYFEKSNLEVLSDIEKYNIAKDNNKECCRVYTAAEYTEKLNNFMPMDRHVFTYIVNVPV